MFHDRRAAFMEDLTAAHPTELLGAQPKEDVQANEACGLSRRRSEHWRRYELHGAVSSTPSGHVGRRVRELAGETPGERVGGYIVLCVEVTHSTY